jgi:hypothetical protein
MFDEYDNKDPKEMSEVRKRMLEFYSKLSKQDIEFFVGMAQEADPQQQQEEK